MNDNFHHQMLELQELTRHGVHKRAIKESPAVNKLDFRTFNERIGNPWSRILDERVPLTDYQVFYHECINKYQRVMVNKTKKGAFTEAFLRHAAKEVFGHYAGHEVIFMAGNAAPIALDVLSRFNDLFEEENGFIDQNDKKWSYGDIIMSFTRSTPMKIELYNGTKILGTPASKSGKAQAMRGYSDVVAWFLTEAAHTGLNDDWPIMNGLTSLTANRHDGHSILESTPNGKRGFFYELWYEATNKLQNTFQMGENSYYTLEYDYQIAVDNGVISSEFIEREKKNKKIDFDQEYGCFDKETEVLTEKGFKLFSELDQTEKIASLNTTTLDIEYVLPIGYLKQKSKELIHFKNRWCNLRVTPNHQMLIHKLGGYHKGKKYPKRFGFREADQIKKHDQFYRTSKWKGKSPDFITINDFKMKTESFCKLMGYYLSEGNTTDKTYDGHHTQRVSITQIKHRNKMFEDLREIGFILQQKTITSTNKSLVKYLKQFGFSYEKFIPKEIKELSPNYIRIFLDAFNLGDGTLRPKQHIENFHDFDKKKFITQKFHYTSSKQMADDICELILKVGKTPSIHMTAPKGTPWKIRGRSGVSNYDAWEIHEGSRTHAKVITMKIQTEMYDDYVYCVELPKNNTLYVRRKGQCVWSGNCKFTTADSAAFDDLVPSNFTENDAMDLSSL